MRHVVRALATHHEVDVLVVREPEQAHVERLGGARVLRVPVVEEGLRERVESFRRALRRQIEGAEYDVVHFRDGWSGSLVLEMREQHGYQTVYDAARAPLAEPPLMDLALSSEQTRNEEACLMQADHVLVPTELAQAHVLRLRSKGVHVVPPGVDVDLFDWAEPSPGPPTVLYAGAVEAGRGLRVLFRAMAAVAEVTEARLVIAGRITSATAASLASDAADLGLQDRLELRGEVAHEAMPELIAEATVCIAPAAVEVSAQPMALFPTKILEFMACRRAVIAPRRGSAGMLIEHGVTGLLFQPGDVADLAHKLVSLLHDTEGRQRMADAGYGLVRERHTASAVRRAVRQAYAAMQIHDTRPHHALGAEPAQVAQAAPETTPGAPGLGAQAGTGVDASRAAMDAVLAELDEAERTDQLSVPYPGLPPGSADATEVELMQLQPRSAPAPSPMRDTMPDPGPASSRAVSSVDTFQMPALGLPWGPGAPSGPAASPVPIAVPSAVPRAGRGSGPTPVQTPVQPLGPAQDEQASRDYRSVSGEVEVRAPGPGQTEPDPDEGEAFTAVSVLLGSSKDAGD
jgi:glycosyltransferase involved in cell wall biosynthesis